jgi:hypothetical protein
MLVDSTIHMCCKYINLIIAIEVRDDIQYQKATLLIALTQHQTDYWDRTHFTRPSVKKGLLVDQIKKAGLSIKEFLNLHVE